MYMQHPKGILIAIGGAEDKGTEKENENRTAWIFLRRASCSKFYSSSVKNMNHALK
jgi:hypothetical protein